MTSGTIILYRYKSFIFNKIAPLNLYSPSPHKFYSVGLQSTGWDTKSMQELLSEMKTNVKPYKKIIADYRATVEELKTIRKAKALDENLPDKSQNWEMKQIMKHYETYFDEESGNTRQEGIEQLEKYIKEEAESRFNIYKKLQTKMDEIKEEITKRREIEKNQRAAEENQRAAEENQRAAEENQRAVEENQNTFLSIFPIITINSFSILRILLTIFSCLISFKCIDFNLNYLMLNIPEITIPIMLTSIVLFVWEYYRLYSKVRKSYKVGKIIYIFCKEKVYPFYKKICKKF